MTNCDSCKCQYIEKISGMDVHCCAAAETDNSAADFFNMEEDDKKRVRFTDCPCYLQK